MAYIDPNAGALLVMPDGVASARAEHQRSGWLRALESSGWHDILADMRSFSSLSTFDPSPHGGDDLPDGKPSKNMLGPESESELPHTKTAAKASESTVERTTIAAGQGSRSVSTPDGLAWGGAPYCLSNGMGIEDEGGTPGASRAGLLAREQAAPVPAQKMVILQTADNGVEVWVRDASMSKVQMQLLLSDMRRNIRNQGGELARLSLNGRQVYASRQPDGECETEKGD